jgi:hypothetical protein
MDSRVAGLASFAGQTALVLLFSYVVARWVAVPVLERLPAGVGYVVEVVAVLLLLPEYALTTVWRRIYGRPLPLAHTYGEVVCAAAGAVYKVIHLVILVLHKVATRVGHRGALVAAAAVVVMIHVR